MSAPPFNLVGVFKDQDVAGWWASEKLDGVRAYWDGKSLRSRRGNRFSPPQWWIDRLPKDVHLDGELYGGRGTFDEVSGIVRRKDADAEWKKVRFHIFDLPKDKGSYEQRYAKVKKLVAKERKRKGHSVLRHVPQTKVKDGDEARRKAKAIIAKGGEGIVLHEPGAAYVPGSRRELLKLKGLCDAEAIVVRRIPGTGKHKGRMGALEVEDAKTGKGYKVGTGFTDTQRDQAARLFKKGTVITVAFTERTKTGTPRFPRFVRVRDDEPKRKKNPEEISSVKRRLLAW